MRTKSSDINIILIMSKFNRHEEFETHYSSKRFTHICSPVLAQMAHTIKLSFW